MKLKVGTKLRVELTRATKTFYKGERGELIVTEVSTDNKVISGNFYPEGTTGFGGMSWPDFKLIKVRKPYREMRVNDRSAPHGVKSKLVLRVWPNGMVEVLESGRRQGYETTVAAIYVRCLMTQVFKDRMAKSKRRKNR